MTLIWTAILVLAIAAEAMTIDLVSIWFGVGALIALLSLLFFDASLKIQIALFLIVSLACIIFTRPVAKKYLRGNTIKTNYDRIIGKHATVTSTITADKKGEVKVMGNIWSATSLNNEVIEEGQHVEVLAIEGNHVVVKEIL